MDSHAALHLITSGGGLTPQEAQALADKARLETDPWLGWKGLAMAAAIVFLSVASSAVIVWARGG